MPMSVTKQYNLVLTKWQSRWCSVDGKLTAALGKVMALAAGFMTTSPAHGVSSGPNGRVQFGNIFIECLGKLRITSELLVPCVTCHVPHFAQLTYLTWIFVNITLILVIFAHSIVLSTIIWFIALSRLPAYSLLRQTQPPSLSGMGNE